MFCDLEPSFSLSLSYSDLFPFLMSSPCLVNGGCRTYRLDLDIITKSSSLSSSSSTTSDSNIYTPISISTKRARSPRKRPNQNSAEAAALLSTISPKLFSPAILLQRSNYFPVSLPSPSATDESTLLLLEKPSVENAPIRFDSNVSDTSLCSLPYCQFKDPVSPEFDAESILDEEGEECIDSIIGVGNLSVSSGCVKEGGLECLMGFGFGILSNMKQALRQKDKGEWWRADVVDVKDIAPKMNVELEKAKKKKKDKLETGDSSSEDGILELRLWLKLDYDGVIKEWSGGSPFFGAAASVESATNVIARLASIDLLPDGGGGVLREASMQRYKEKRMTRLFSKKIRYQVRKVNADHRPRLKGRFVRTQSLLHEPLAEENQLR